MDRLFLAGFIVALAAAVWWLALRNDDLRDARDHIQAEKETVERIENAPDIDLGDDADRTRELCRLAGLSDCPL
ncbi:MAG: hypothetical protein ACRBB0_15195 [Pelagimonas sp.]|uniref:hypothetical protein n=1 Tax=Pelagimonas sp. TaxID=2073170 RepID=UPI003D6AD3FE